MPTVRVGTAGWTIPKVHSHALAEQGSHLERYSRTFSCTEINSTFYRPSRESTWLRWAASVPEDFRFAVKAPKTITHEAALKLTAECSGRLDEFLEQVRLLGAKLGPLLFQLPPKQTFDATSAANFFEHLRSRHQGTLVIEPRHASWFSPEADSLLRDLRVVRAAADPARAPEASEPGGFKSLTYYRLHGSPRQYYSEYGQAYVEKLAATVQEKFTDAEVWVIFDNTASGAALGDALAMLRALRGT